MQFGLCNAASTLQRFVDEILRGLNFVYAFIDDILVASSSEAEHIQHLRFLFQRSGIKPLEDRVEAILKFPQPTTITQLRRFLGMLNYYRRFIRQAAHILAPLVNFLKVIKNKKRPKRKVKIKPEEVLEWTDEATTAFELVKQALAHATLLHHPTPNAPLSIWVDASDFAVGGALAQYYENVWQPLAFLSMRDIKAWVNSCHPCQRSKIHRHTKAPIGTFDLPDARFSQIHVDFIGPFPPSNGQSYCLTVVDRFNHPKANGLCWKDCIAISRVPSKHTRIQKPPLSQNYTGPHEVIRRTDKVFTILINGKRKTVSIDRVKPAYVWDDTDDIPLTGISKQTDPHSKDKTMSHVNKTESQPNKKTVNITRSGRHATYPANKQAKEEAACVGLNKSLEQSLQRNWACIIQLKNSSRDAFKEKGTTSGCSTSRTGSLPQINLGVQGETQGVSTACQALCSLAHCRRRRRWFDVKRILYRHFCTQSVVQQTLTNWQTDNSTPVAVHRRAANCLEEAVLSFTAMLSRYRSSR
ncbi:hypothetical protein TNCV_3538711 [Trichonephila clavipes]|nr:hypothetical protein TNCV_3538711 [Trichonephila clavipes]